MAFTTPKENQPGGIFNRTYAAERVSLDPGPKQTLVAGERCGLCATTDPAEFAACERQICFSEPIPAPSPFTAPRALISAYSLAARYQAAADKLDWEEDELRAKYLARARALRKGDVAEVPDEEI